MQKQHIDILDGIRGLLAFWVMYGHLKMFVLVKEPLIGSAGLAVDMFMFLSGFLMAYHWQERESRFSGIKQQASDFYIRRFFRIAPLYYLLLVVAWLGQDYFFQFAREIKAINPPPWAEAEAAFNKPTDSTLNWQNIITHLSFTFGIFPKFAYNNALPDWSISLEMQFYAVFPFIMFFLGRLGQITTLTAAVVLTYVTHRFFGLYLETGPLGNYPQPAMLLFKLNVFFCGIFVARSYLSGFRDVTSVLLAAASLFNGHPRVISIIILVVFLLALDPARKEGLNRLLSNRLFRFLGDTSYSVYLLHMLILLPVVHKLLHTGWYLKQRGLVQLGIALLAVAIPVYGISYLLYRFIEQPGIELGRKLVKRLNLSQKPNPNLAQA